MFFVDHSNAGTGVSYQWSIDNQIVGYSSTYTMNSYNLDQNYEEELIATEGVCSNIEVIGYRFENHGGNIVIWDDTIL